MGFRVRAATASDARSIARVQVDGWRTTYRGIVPDGYLDAMDVQAHERFWREQMEAGQSLTFVAEVRTEVVGFVSGGAVRGRFSGYDAELYAIYLRKAQHGRGAGAAMVRVLAEALKADGYRGMMVWALAENPAVGFYKRLGARAISGKITVMDEARVPELALGWGTLEGLGEAKADSLRE